MKEFEWFEWFEWFGPSPIEPFNSGLDVETTLSESLDLIFIYGRKGEKVPQLVALMRHLSKSADKRTVVFVATKHHAEFFNVAESGRRPSAAAC